MYPKLLITYQPWSINFSFYLHLALRAHCSALHFIFITSRSLPALGYQHQARMTRITHAPTSSKVWWFGTGAVFNPSSHTFRSHRSDGHPILICLSVRVLSHSYQPYLIKCPSLHPNQAPHQLLNPSTSSTTQLLNPSTSSTTQPKHLINYSTLITTQAHFTKTGAVTEVPITATNLVKWQR